MIEEDTIDDMMIMTDFRNYAVRVLKIQARTVSDNNRGSLSTR